MYIYILRILYKYIKCMHIYIYIPLYTIIYPAVGELTLAG